MSPLARIFPIVAIVLTLAAFQPAEPAPPSDKAGVLESIDLADLAGGSYFMGVPEGEEHEQQAYPGHIVRVKPFRIARTDVTFDQFDVFARATGAPLPQDEGFGRGTRPVIDVDRAEALAFIAWLNAGTGRHFRLPTEAEWEYAARAGGTTPYFWGAGQASDYANLQGTGGRDQFMTTSPVASFLPNAFGLYDMAGNVWQMVEDCRHATLVGAPVDGSAWVDRPCDCRIARGGWYSSLTRGSRVTARAAVADGFRSMGLGFRLAEDAAPASSPRK
jgi:formylglycine-generating enzyme required for sulfatase activity